MLSRFGNSTQSRRGLDPREAYRHLCADRELLNHVPAEAPDVIKAAAGNSVELVLDWISKGGDVNARDSEGYTALHYAARRDHGNVVRTLLQHGAEVGGSAPCSPLLLAIFHDSSLALDVLLYGGEDPTKLNDGFGTVYNAAFYGALKCTEVLLKHNGDVNWIGQAQLSALAMAVSILHADNQKFRNDRDTILAVMQTLVASDEVKLDFRNLFGYTALHVAARVGSIEAVQCLIEAGANPSITDQQGLTPADNALKHTGVREYLLSCQSPVSLVALERPGDDDGGFIAPHVQTAARLVDPDVSITLSVRNVSSSLTVRRAPGIAQRVSSTENENHPTTASSLESQPGNVSSSLPVRRAPGKAQQASSSETNPMADAALETHRPCSQLALSTGTVEQKTLFTLHELSSPPVISVSNEAFQPSRRKPTSKKEKKAVRKEEKRIGKEAATVMKDAVLVEASSDTVALSGSRQVFQFSEPLVSKRSSLVVSPFTAIGTNHPVTLKEPARLIIPHAARPVVSGPLKSSVDLHLTVHKMSLRDDGRGLSCWISVNSEDIHSSDDSVALTLRKFPLFSTYVVTADQHKKNQMKDEISDWMRKELDFCVLGSQYYSKQMMPRVVCFTNGSTPRAVCKRLAGDGTVERLVVWGPSQAVQVSVDEDVTMKLSMKQEDWTVDPEEQRMQKDILRSSRAIHSVAFVLASPSTDPCEASGLCSVQVSGVQEPLRLPFCTPTTRNAVIRDLSLGDTEKRRQLGYVGAISRKNELPVEYAHDAGTQTGAEDDADVLEKSRNPQPVSDPCIASATEPKSSGLRNEISGTQFPHQVSHELFRDEDVGPRSRKTWRDVAQALGYTSINISACNPRAVFEAVLHCASSRWHPIGLKLGFHQEQLSSMVRGISEDADKLQLIIRRKAAGIGDQETANLLLSACHEIHDPVIADVLKEVYKK